MGAAMAGFAPSSAGQIVLFSTPTLLGEFTTDANGVLVVLGALVLIDRRRRFSR